MKRPQYILVSLISTQCLACLASPPISQIDFEEIKLEEQSKLVILKHVLHFLYDYRTAE